MSNQAARDLAPIDYAVVEFPPGTDRFTGELAREISSLVEAELIRLVDLLVVEVRTDGSIHVREFEDLGEIRAPAATFALTDRREVLGPDDVAALAAGLERGRAFGVIVYENTWAAHIGGAARDMGGRVVTSGRISAGEGSWDPDGN